MGGGARISPPPQKEESSALDHDFSQPSSSSLNVSYHSSIDLRGKVEDGTVNEEYGLAVEGFEDVGWRISPSSLDFEVNQRKRRNAYREVLQSYEQLWVRSEHLEEAKSKILSYTPGTWIEKVGGMNLSDYCVPKSTTLLLVGPKGSGKSSLVNRISKVFEDDEFASARAQVSYNSSVEDGTYFLQEYMIPRGSTSFCLYDTRGLSDDSSENIEMVKDWVTNGVHHGKLIIRRSDSLNLRSTMKCKARVYGCLSKTKMVNFLIFVVDGVAVLKSMDSDNHEETQYLEKIAEMFNCPYLSFKDDKPVVVVTHGDLLALADRARIRAHLGELLGIPPAKQIFDIPECCDRVTDLTIMDMLRYSLEHADKNLPHKDLQEKVRRVCLSACISLFIIVGVAIAICAEHFHISKYHKKIPFRRSPQSKDHIDWGSIRHLWLE